MVSVDNLDLTPESRQQYLDELTAEIDSNGYPECNPSLVYSILDATYAETVARDLGYEEFADEVQNHIDEVLDPVANVDPDKIHIGEFSDEELSLRDTNQAFYEALGAFGERDGEIIHGWDIANEFINAERRPQARQQLEEFQSWYETELDNLFSDVEQQVLEGEVRQYTPEEYKQTALYNGLRILLHRRESVQPFPAEEMRLP